LHGRWGGGAGNGGAGCRRLRGAQRSHSDTGGGTHCPQCSRCRLSIEYKEGYDSLATSELTPSLTFGIGASNNERFHLCRKPVNLRGMTTPNLRHGGFLLWSLMTLLSLLTLPPAAMADSYIQQYQGQRLYAWDGKYLSQYQGRRLYEWDGRYLSQYQGSRRFDWDGRYISEYQGSRILEISGKKISQYQGRTLFEWDGQYVQAYQGSRIFSIDGSVPQPVLALIAAGFL